MLIRPPSPNRILSKCLHEETDTAHCRYSASPTCDFFEILTTQSVLALLSLVFQFFQQQPSSGFGCQSSQNRSSIVKCSSFLKLESYTDNSANQSLQSHQPFLINNSSQPLVLCAAISRYFCQPVSLLEGKQNVFSVII